ncbi:MAG TPA: hypothetical protein VIU62_00525 [Chloroflexota bacterium]|jgi:hypothetical protein
MGFLKKFLGGTPEQAGPRVPTRAQPDTIDTAEIVWKCMQDLVDEINKNGPSGSITGTPLQVRVKLRDEITVIGERLGTTRAKVKARPTEYTSQSAGILCRNLAEQAAIDPFCALPLVPTDTASASIVDTCTDYADRVQKMERDVEHDRRMEHDQRRL